MTNPAKDFVAQITQSGRFLCPECSEGRKKTRRPSLSVSVYDGRNVFDCHHCGWQGAVSTELDSKYTTPLPSPPPKIIAIPTALNSNKDIIQEFFTARGAPITNMSEMPHMTTGRKYFHGIGETDAVGFIYGDPKEPSAIKWRCVPQKGFTSDGPARTFYGLERLDEEPKEVIIVEGECDVIALASISIKAISCPNGAQPKFSNRMISPEEDIKFSYLWDARNLLDNAETIVIATDGDQCGEALREEIARRVGRAKVCLIDYPEGCKDVTDILRVKGKGAVFKAFEDKYPMPLVGVYGVQDYLPKLYEHYEKGLATGESTGFVNVDKLCTLVEGEGRLWVVTGLPSSGKSEFVDAVMMNMAESKSWKFAVASFENPPAIHIAKLAEKKIRKPFYEGLSPRINREDLKVATDFIDEHFVFLESRDGTLSTIDSILERTRQAILRKGCRGLVIDPYNYLEHEKSDEGEHQSISTMLTKVTTFAKAYDIHVFFVAHPAKIYPNQDGIMPIVKGVHISGSAAWFAKADFGITVHRGSQGVEIHCWKVRFKWEGSQGVAHLGYDIPTGTYFEIEQPDDLMDDLSPKGVYGKKRLNKSQARHWQDVDLDDLEF